MRIHRLFPVAIGMLMIASCGSPAKGSGDAGNLQAVLANVVAPYQVLDIASGTVEARADLTGLDPTAIRTTKIVFRAAGPGTATRGSDPASLGHQSDETSGVISQSRYFIAIYELTQGQWSALLAAVPAGSSLPGTIPAVPVTAAAVSQPWTLIVPASQVGGASGVTQAPAFAVSHFVASGVFSLYGSGRAITLDLPTGDQWEYAARGGSSGPWSWGADASRATVAQYAVVAETTAGIAGPRTVGGRRPNGLGLYDMAGNVWEWTKEGEIRGGSWSDPLLQARCANRIDAFNVFTDIRHALVGVRPVLVLR